MLFLKQSTASQSVLLGPFVDDTDGATAETGLTIANTDIRLSKNGGNMAAKNSGGGTHDENGYYTITLDATDTNTVGRLQVSCKVAGALAVWMEFQVLEEAIYDALIASSAAAFDSNQRVDVGEWLGTAVTTSSTTSKPEVDVNSISDDATAANNLETACDNYSATRGLSGTALPAVAAGGAGGLPISDAGGLDMDAILSRIGTPSNFGSGTSTLAANLEDLADDGTAVYDRTTDSLQAIRDRGDAAWVTGAGGSDRLLMVDTTIATLASQTSFTLTAGSADDDAYNGCTIIIEDSSTSTQKAVGIVDDYTGSTRTVTLLEDPGVFTMAATDKIYILAEKSVKPTTAANYHLDINATGEAGIDLDNTSGTLQDSDIDTLGVNVTHLQGVPVTFAGGIPADVVAVSGDATAANNLEADYDGTGYAKANSTIGTTTTNTDMRGTDSAYTGTPPTVSDIWTTALTESYGTDGSNATGAQLLYLLLSACTEFAISGTTITCKQLNGTTTAATYTLDDSANPTSRTRAT